MIVILSPSKTLNFDTKATTTEFTKSPFTKQTKQLIAEMAKMSPDQIQEMMKISDKLADLNYQRFQNFQFPFTLKNSKQALFTFIGDVYKDIDVNNYSKSQLQFAQQTIRIISGLYGILKPLDLMQPYRLEMKYRTNFWKPFLTKELQKETDTIINLASNEYSKPINLQEFQTYTPIFKEKKGDKYKIIALYAKIARGTMANWIIKNHITKPKDLLNFQEDGYKYNKALSTESEFVFTRN